MPVSSKSSATNDASRMAAASITTALRELVAITVRAENYLMNEVGTDFKKTPPWPFIFEYASRTAVAQTAAAVTGAAGRLPLRHGERRWFARMFVWMLCGL